MVTARAAVAAALALALLAAGSAAAERRVALVIGNADYAALDPLKNPVNDAVDVAGALEGLGFEVTLATDLGRTGMINAVSRHIRAAREADVSLLFYAGHGFQVDARNYLAPVDAELRTVGDVGEQTIEVAEVTAPLVDSSGIHLVFLDACRENPLGSGAFRDGLARPEDAAGFLFAYATRTDDVAYDGVGRNGFFTQALLSHINTPAQDVAATLIAVRRDVIAATGGRQVPVEFSSLTREFQFAPGEATPPIETMLWHVAAAAADPDLMTIYLERYPEGAHVNDVREFLGGDGAGGTEAVRGRTGDAPEAALWDVAKRTRERAIVEAYLRQHPNGRHVAEARRLLETLPHDEDVGANPALLCERLATHPRDATANAPGVLWATLARQAPAAIEACAAAIEAYPERARYVALLARATYYAGRREEAAALYREAAERGDLRAMVSLGVMHEDGDAVRRDPEAAAALYARAAEGGSPDGMINLALAALQGHGVPRDPARGVELMRRAAEEGSGIATYNLGALAERGAVGRPEDALDLFLRAAALGQPRGYLAAAILLDEGRGVERDPVAAADMLLEGVASDGGEAYAHLTTRAAEWSPETLRAAQAKLRAAGLYDGALDGVSGPRFAAALKDWRNGGWLRAAVSG
jgi:tetratricopeptide (TPR) repeat protein